MVPGKLLRTLVLAGLASVQVCLADAFTFTTIDFTPRPPPDGFTEATTPTGINDAGQIAGVYFGPLFCCPTTYHGFLYANGSYTLIDQPGAGVIVVNGINNLGQIVGSGGQIFGDWTPFVYTNAIFTSIQVSGSYLRYGVRR